MPTPLTQAYAEFIAGSHSTTIPVAAMEGARKYTDLAGAGGPLTARR